MIYLAIDFGGGSGRVIAGKLENGKLEMELIHRFPNRQVRLGNHVYWDFLALFEDMKTGLENGSILLAMGNSDVPVGQYTQKILTYLGLDETSLANAGNITYGSNVKEVTTQVSEAAVDCGIVYQTDAYSAGLTVVDTATSEMCGQVG